MQKLIVASTYVRMYISFNSKPEGLGENIKMDLKKLFSVCYLCFFILSLLATTANAQSRISLNNELTDLLNSHPLGLDGFKLPAPDQLNLIPQDWVNNPLTSQKVALGALLYHETAVGTETPSQDRQETYSCATCHHAAAGFKAGIPQGIADGGVGFADAGASRVLGEGLNPDALDGDPDKPDIQPVASPTTLNSAYQPVMLWNGSFGNGADGINGGVAGVNDAGPMGIKANEFGLPGLETQVLAGTRVHRLRFDDGSVLQTNRRYERLYRRAFPDGDTGFIPPGSDVTSEALGAAKAIAAYERTLLANEAPFQRWLNGSKRALSVSQLRGALLFFGSADCVECHTGPALSSLPDATEDRIFFNVGFADFDTSDPQIHGSVPADVKSGRGGFTGQQRDDNKFKIATLYNAGDASVLGHGSSFTSVGEVIRYKNMGVSQRTGTFRRNLASEFQPLGLNEQELNDLINFVENGLRDSDLARYQPKSLPTGNCFPAADMQSALDLECF